MLKTEEFFDIAESMLRAAQYTEWTGEALNDLDDGDIIFKRAIEMLVENVSAIRLLTFSGFIRPAFSNLRTTIDLVAAFCWLCQKPNERRAHYLTRQLSAQKTMTALGWTAEYDQFYRSLSKYTHADFRLNRLYKYNIKIDEVGGHDLSANAEFMLSEGEGIQEFHFVEDLSKEELLKEFGHLLGFKTFDYVLAMLLNGSGPYADSHVWWPGKDFMDAFDEFAQALEPSNKLLWLHEKRKLKLHIVSGWFR